MKIIYRTDDGIDFENQDDAIVHEIFEMAHESKHYETYAPIEGFGGTYQDDLVNNIEKYLTELINKINEPIVHENKQIADPDILKVKANTDLGYVSIGDFCCSLLLALFQDGEGFSGKCPFGNSDWDYHLYESLVRAQKLEGLFDADGYIEEMDTNKGRQMICDAIKQLFTDIK